MVISSGSFAKDLQGGHKRRKKMAKKKQQPKRRQKGVSSYLKPKGRTTRALDEAGSYGKKRKKKGKKTY
ncbi:MAG: hypothetical protein GY757_53745 [bacterium]|nr:hypothetical protein [bacterium]